MLAGTIGEAMTYEFLTFAEDMSKRFAPENILNNYKEVRPEIQETINSEFTEEDADLDLSKLSTIVSTLAGYVAEKVANDGMVFYVSDEEREKSGMTKKKALKINKQGHNLALFLSDCPSENFNSFNATFKSELKSLLGSSREMEFTSFLKVINGLTNYKEYVAVAQAYMEARAAR